MAAAPAPGLAGPVSPGQESRAARASLERFLVEGSPLPDRTILARRRLEAYAYAAVPTDHPAGEALRRAHTRAAAVHLAHKAAFLPLLRAWRDAGIEVIVFKGFYLAEFVYEQPAQRHYSDIDVIMRPESWPIAEPLAVGLGWTVEWRRRSSLYTASHEEALLTKAGMVLEVQRFPIDCPTPFQGLHRRYAAAAWAASRELHWEGTTLRVLAPEDSALLGLVLARAWSEGDDWHLKASDYLDLIALGERFDLRAPDLERRAEQLGCVRTLRLFLERCDPFRRRLSLRPPASRERRRWYRLVTPERGHLGLERLLVTALRMPGTLLDVLLQLPRLLRTQRELRSGRLPVLPPETPRRAAGHPLEALRTKERLVRGIKWGARLLQPGRDACRLRSFALAAALRAAGVGARVLEGTAREQGVERRHAWVELDGLALRDLEDVQVCRVDEVVGRHPPLDSGTRRAA
jgi:hypothetical protein